MTDNSEVEYKELDDQFIATIRFDMKERKEAYPYLEKIKKAAENGIIGPPFLLFHGGTGVKDGYDVEVGYPVKHKISSYEIRTYRLEDRDVISYTHHGSYENIGKSYQKIIDHMKSHGLIPMPQSRQILINENPDDPEENIVEIQLFVHNWIDKLDEGIQEVLGEDARDEIMEGVDEIDFDSSWEERFDFVVNVMEKLAERTEDDYERYRIVSCCADKFSKRRIKVLRDIYVKNNDIDEVLEAMRDDPEWYANPIREGDTIYETKRPYDKEGYEKAESEEEKRKAYCHCWMIRENLEEVPPIYCNCGSGWYRQLWEGITGKPVKIEVLRSLTNGDDECSFAIHLGV